MKDRLIFFETTHSSAQLPEAAEEWVREHYRILPPEVRPTYDELKPFCALFSTYLVNSFDLVGNPGMQRYSPENHCFCPLCSWLVEAPHLKTKKVRSGDKQRAQKLKARALLNVAQEHHLDATEADIAQLLNAPQVSEDACLVAYGIDLFERVEGIANGPAILALWRGFAWNLSGSPKHGFRLDAEKIVDAEARLVAALQERGR